MSETILFPSRGSVPPRPPKTARVFRLPRVPPKKWMPWILGTMILALAAYEHFGHETPQPADLETRALASGRAFAPHLAAALADGFDAAAHAIQNGKSVSEADSVLKQVFHDARAKAFQADAAGLFHAVVPDGSEPPDNEVRRRFAQLHHMFARGLREAR